MKEEQTESVEGRFIEMLDAIQNGAAKIGDATIEYAPDVADALLWVVRIDSAEPLLAGFALLIGVIFCIKPMKQAWKWAKKYSLESDGLSYVAISPLVATFCAAALETFRRLTDVWNWIGVIEPKLKVAKMIVDGVM